MEVLHDLGIEWQLLLAQAIAFVVLYLVLRKYLFGALGAMIEERRAQIAETRTRAEQAASEAQQLQQQHQTELQKLIDQRNRILDDAKAEGRKAADEISAQARASAEELLDRAQRDVERERVKTLAELRAQVASLVVAGTEKLLRREVGPEDQAAFVDEFAKELEQDEDQRSG